MACCRCERCDQFVDDDWDPCTDVEGWGLICSRCLDEILDESGFVLEEYRKPGFKYNEPVESA